MIAIKDMEMPKSCAECCFSLSDREDGGYYCTRRPISGLKGAYYKGAYKLYGEWHNKEKCPLVEIEPLSDEEKRIFLSAMGKERVICKQIDIDKVDDGSIKKLVPIVNTIERKIKKVLWN